MKQTHIGVTVTCLTLLSLLALGCDPAPKEAPETTTVTTETTTTEPAVAGPPAPPGPPGANYDKSPFKASGKPVKIATGLQYEDMTIGKGPEATQGSRATVHYTGTLTDGTQFDSSRDRNEPFSFTIGAGEVIKGWDDGVAGMKVGGRRKLTIPYDSAYGEAGRPPKIPPKATLLFDVELMGVE